MAKVRKRRNDFATQAALDTVVRFGPEQSGLNALIRQAYADRSTGRAQATGTARTVIDAVDQARPQVKQIYNDAGVAAARSAKTLIGKDLAGLNGAADSIVAGAALEQKGAADRLEQARSSALTDLATRRVSAKQGRQFALQNTQREFVDTVAKVLTRQQDLRREQGAFAASEVGKLRQSELDRQTRLDIAGAGNQQSERNSLRTAGIDPDTGAPIPGGKLDPKAKPKKPPSASDLKTQRSFNQDFQSALTLLRTEVDPDKSLGRRNASPSLVNGEPAVKKKSKSKDNVTQEQILVNEIKPHDALAVRVANDMYYDGHLSPETVRLLHANGVRVKGLSGVSTNRKRDGRRKRPTAGGQGGAFDQILSAIGY